jgi:hypothetical protein
MKYSQWMGLAFTVIVIIACYLPWMQVPVLQTVATGMDSGGTNLGKPGKLTMIFCVIAAILFVIPRVWAKRVNLVFCALAVAWAVRNFLLYARCEMGTCPVRKYGIYIMLAGTLLMFLAALFPDTSVKERK